MSHAIYECARPVIFAHRGSSRYAPENTIAAFDLAKKQGAIAVELDTMLSRDGIPVVIHDRRLDRTTNGNGKVDRLSYQELSELDAGSSFSPLFKGEKIPRLRDILERYRGGLIINIELKNFHSPRDHLVETVVAMVDEMNLTHSIIYSSFLPANLRKVTQISPQSITALICMPGLRGKWFASSYYLAVSEGFIHPFWQDVSLEMIRREHQRNRRVHVWTVNDGQTAAELDRKGIDGIMTDDPPTIFSVLGQ
jgi:glycerophosphoryl diester phosphodiesterase